MSIDYGTNDTDFHFIKKSALNFKSTRRCLREELVTFVNSAKRR